MIKSKNQTRNAGPALFYFKAGRRPANLRGPIAPALFGFTILVFCHKVTLIRSL